MLIVNTFYSTLFINKKLDLMVDLIYLIDLN
jgi:hypothetical protein